MAPKPVYRRGKREEGEEPVSKHQIRSGDGRWVGRRGVGRQNPRRETQVQGKNGDSERGMVRKSHRAEEILGAQTKAARKSRAAPSATKKRGIELVRVDGGSQLPRTASGRWRWMGRRDSDGR